MTTTDDRIALVTGASRGIGLATVRALREEGFRVAGVARTVDGELERTADHAIAADLAEPDAPARVVADVLDAFGHLDVLVNNVGAFTARTDGFEAVTDAQWQASLELNLLSPVRTARAALGALVEREGALVNVISIAARVPMSAVVDYAAAKAAMLNLSQTLAEEYGPRGVRVNAVSPGPTHTPAWDGPDGFGTALAADAGMDVDAFLEAFPEEAGLSTGRMTEPDEVAAVIALLASGRVRNLHGTNLVVDGGQDKAA